MLKIEKIKESKMRGKLYGYFVVSTSVTVLRALYNQSYAETAAATFYAACNDYAFVFFFSNTILSVLLILTYSLKSLLLGDLREAEVNVIFFNSTS